MEHAIHILHIGSIEAVPKADPAHITISRKQFFTGFGCRNFTVCGQIEIVKLSDGHSPGLDGAASVCGYIPGILRCVGQRIKECHGCDLTAPELRTEYGITPAQSAALVICG